MSMSTFSLLCLVFTCNDDGDQSKGSYLLSTLPEFGIFQLISSVNQTFGKSSSYVMSVAFQLRKCTDNLEKKKKEI